MNRRTFIALTATAAAASHTRCSGQSPAVPPVDRARLGASNTQLLMAHDITSKNEALAEKYHVLTDGDVKVALVPQAFESSGV